MPEVKPIWVAYTNSDCTEGRGYDVPLAVCEIEATARRLGKGKWVQGLDAPIRHLEMRKIDGEWYVPSCAVRIHAPTKDDAKAEDAAKRRKAAIDRAKACGLTDDEIRELRES